MDYLATYEGPGGPISAEFSSPSPNEAVSTVLVRAQGWYDEQSDVLGLTPDQPVPDVLDVLDDWTRVQAEGLPAGWRLYGAREELEELRIYARKKDIRCSGKGELMTRRLRLPGGATGWATDLVEDLEGEWYSGAYLARERHCEQIGYVPVGTVVLEYTSTIRSGRKCGAAARRAGVVVAEKGEEPRIEWGLRTRGPNDAVEVLLGDEWGEV